MRIFTIRKRVITVIMLTLLIIIKLIIARMAMMMMTMMIQPAPQLDPGSVQRTRCFVRSRSRHLCSKQPPGGPEDN